MEIQTKIKNKKKYLIIEFIPFCTQWKYNTWALCVYLLRKVWPEHLFSTNCGPYTSFRSCTSTDAKWIFWFISEDVCGFLYANKNRHCPFFNINYAQIKSICFEAICVFRHWCTGASSIATCWWVSIYRDGVDGSLGTKA